MGLLRRVREKERVVSRWAHSDNAIWSEEYQETLMTKTRQIHLYGPSPQEITRIDNCNVQGHLICRQEGEQLEKLRRELLQEEAEK